MQTGRKNGYPNFVFKGVPEDSSQGSVSILEVCKKIPLHT